MRPSKSPSTRQAVYWCASVGARDSPWWYVVVCSMNLVHDPRWGRAQEVYSVSALCARACVFSDALIQFTLTTHLCAQEDPKLSSDLTIGIVTGMQDNEVGSVVGSSGHILSAACCKREHACAIPAAYAYMCDRDCPLHRRLRRLQHRDHPYRPPPLQRSGRRKRPVGDLSSCIPGLYGCGKRGACDVLV